MSDIRKNDHVQVISGKDRGKTGRVVNVAPKKNRVMVEGVARVVRHSKPSQKNRQGGLVTKEMFVDLSNVQIVCRQCGKATRVGHRTEDGVKARFCRRCGAET